MGSTDYLMLEEFGSKVKGSDDVHFSYGGGLYLVPYVESFNLNASFARPNEGKSLFNFRIVFFVRKDF